MKATGVIVRFLSLLDVALILLGVFMVILMYSDVRRQSEDIEEPQGLAEIANVGFLYLYAGWKGEENGKCYFLESPEGQVGREIATDTDEDIKDLIATRERKNHVVMLLFSDDGWYSAWDATKLAEIERVWEVKVIPVYNVRLSPQERP